MREGFGDWVAGLSKEDFACTLAALGVLGANGRPARRKTDGIFKWRLDPRLFAMKAADLASAWRSFRSGARKPIRIFLEPWDLSGIDQHWLESQLTLAGAIVETSTARGLHRRSPLSLLSLDRLYRGELSHPRHESYSLSVDEPETEGDGESREASVRTRRNERPPRFLQARIHSGKRLIRGALHPGQTYSAAIRVGLPDPDWSSVAKPFPTPEEPPEPKGHRLTVIFWEPTAHPEPEVKTLWLPRTGDSEPVEFSFDAPYGVDWIAARVTVLHANRVLQTGLLKAPVGTKGKWTFELDATPRTRLEGLDARTAFDVALVNHEKGMTAASDGQPVVLDVDDGAVRTLIQVLGRQITKIADEPARYKGLASAGSVELLRELAQKGSRVHHHLRLDRLKDARRVHITSVRPESFFPAELLYVHRPPSGEAELCPHALKALQAGDCTGECPSDKEGTVCPLGFWGLSKVIERHAERLESTGRGNLELRPEPVRERRLLPISGSALLAASDRVSEVKKDAVTRLLDKLKKRGDAALATTWEEWKRQIGSAQPRLLVLLPHHDRDEDGDFLEIGDGDRLETDEIWADRVRDPDGPNPVVLLMGCETNLTEISFENPAIVFQDNGAAVVVTTIATILGRHASPATEALVQLLDRMADGKHTFGDIMLRLRQKLVATSTPMALGLTSYGDADWILTREG